MLGIVKDKEYNPFTQTTRSITEYVCPHCACICDWLHINKCEKNLTLKKDKDGNKN